MSAADRIVTRRQWGALEPLAPLARVPTRDRRAFMVHYSTGQELGRADTAAWVRQLQNYHRLHNGWADIGYHWLVDAAGVIYEGRGWGVAGAHCPGWNTTAWGVCFLGNDDPAASDATDAARGALRALYGAACDLAGGPLRRLGHRDAKATACPGDELYAWVHAGMPAPPARTTVTATTTTPGGFLMALNDKQQADVYNAVINGRAADDRHNAELMRKVDALRAELKALAAKVQPAAPTAAPTGQGDASG
jgi:N-acetylmuramoyl-L-alanine amidase